MPDSILQSIFSQDDRVAVIDKGLHHGFFSIQTFSRILARQLGGLNLNNGDRIAVLLPNSLNAVVAFLAVAQTGHSYLPLNIALKPAELKQYIYMCGVGAVLCLAEMKPDLPEGVHVVFVDEILDDAMSGPPVDDAGSRKLAPEREFVNLSTSGSTGDPRVIARTARAVYANVQHVAAGLQVTAEDRFLSVVPFWHANGFSNCLLMPLVCGASIVTMERFLPRPMLELILNEKPTVVIGSPFVFHALAQVVRPDCDLGHVRAWISSGATFPAELDEKLRCLNIQVRQLYGSSETGTISIGSGDQVRQGDVGKPLPGVRVRLVDDNDHEVPRGQAGKIQVSGAALFSYYVDEPGGGNFMTKDGFYRMGDQGLQDLDDSLTLTGRTDALINVSGVKVDPTEIQQVLSSMPGIAQTLVFGTRDSNGMEIIKALLVADGKLNANEVMHYCRTRLAEYKLPRIIEFVDNIPQDLMGKSTRNQLEN